MGRRRLGVARMGLITAALIPAVCFGTAGCGDSGGSDAGGSDAGGSDAGGSDAGGSDAGGSDAGGSDAGGSDAGTTTTPDGIGALSGDCHVLDDELTSSEPFLFRNELDLTGTVWDTADLSAGGLDMWDAGNLGGSSLYSEVFAYEVLVRCEGAELVKTEGEIIYDDEGGKKTDFLATIDGLSIGVSVTRAFVYKNDDAYTVAEATDLLEHKLGDILLSSANVSKADGWDKQILSVLAYSADYADAIELAWPKLDAEIRADTVLYVTVTEGEDDYLY